MVKEYVKVSTADVVQELHRRISNTAHFRSTSEQRKLDRILESVDKLIDLVPTVQVGRR